MVIGFPFTALNSKPKAMASRAVISSNHSGWQNAQGDVEGAS